MNNKLRSNTSKGKIYLTIVAMASLLVMAFNINTNSMNVNAVDFGLISKDTNIGSIDTDTLFNCVGAAITCDNDNTVNNNIAINNGNPSPLTCEECFENALTASEIEALLDVFIGVDTLEEVCNILDTGQVREDHMMSVLISIGVSTLEAQAIIDCLESVGIVFV